MTEEKQTENKISGVFGTNQREETDFDSLMSKRRAKENLLDTNWSKSKLKDVQVYSGYEFTKSELPRKNEKRTIVGVISDEKNPENIIELIDEDELSKYEIESDQFGDVDGNFMYNGRQYLYSKKRWIVLTLESDDGSYQKEYVLTGTPKPESRSLESIYTEVLRSIDSYTSVGSPLDARKKYIRTDKVTNSSRFDMVTSAMARLGLTSLLIFGGFLGAVMTMFSSGSPFVGIAFLFICVSLLSLVQEKVYDGWFEIAPLDWTEELPKSARITDEVSRGIDADKFEFEDDYEKQYTETVADVEVHDDATLEITTLGSDWIFEAEEDGIPNKDAAQLYESYGGIDFSRTEELPVLICKNDERIPKSSNEYVSEDGEWILKGDGL